MHMLQFSSCITNSTIFNQSFEKILEVFIDAGFDAIDIPGEKKEYPIKKIKPIFDTYSNKIKIGELTACINPTRDLVNPDAKKRNSAINYIKYCIDAAAEIGCKLTHMCFITTPENLVNTPREKLENLATQSIKECADYANNKNVKLMVEPLFKADNTIINRCEQAVQLFSTALNMDIDTFMQGKHNFGLLQDIFHMHHEEVNLVEAIKKYNKITYHCHVADHPRGLDFTRKDSGFVKDALKTLDDLGYQNLIAFESFDPAWTLDRLKGSLQEIKKCYI